MKGFRSKKGSFSDDPVKRNTAYCTESIFFSIPSLELCNCHLTLCQDRSCPWPLVQYSKGPFINNVRKNLGFFTPSPLVFSSGSHRHNPPPKLHSHPSPPPTPNFLQKAVGSRYQLFFYQLFLYQFFNFFN